MGCDIHAFVEYQYQIGQAYSVFAKVHISRDYGLFNCLAGVRGYGAEIQAIALPKGIPQDIGYDTKENYCYYISELEQDGNISKQDAEEHISKGYAVRFDEHHISRSDWHSASWLSLAEIKDAYKRYLNYYKENIERPEDIKDAEAFKKFIEETKDIIKPISRNPNLEATIAMLESLSLHYQNVRLVFWFDN